MGREHVESGSDRLEGNLLGGFYTRHKTVF
jgi:hypothetical protein